VSGAILDEADAFDAPAILDEADAFDAAPAVAPSGGEPTPYGANLRAGIAATREAAGAPVRQPRSVNILPPEELAGPHPFDQRTTLQNLGGAVRTGWERWAIQSPTALKVDDLARRFSDMDAVDAAEAGASEPPPRRGTGNTLWSGGRQGSSLQQRPRLGGAPPSAPQPQGAAPIYDPQDYSGADAQGRAAIRANVDRDIVSALQAWRKSQAVVDAIPTSPRLQQMAQQIDDAVARYGVTGVFDRDIWRTFASAPFEITGQILGQSATSLVPAAVSGPLAALAGATRGARMLASGLGALAGDAPARGIEILDEVMQQAGVDLDDIEAMRAFILSNPGVIGNAFRRAGLGSSGLALVNALTAGVARPLIPTGTLRGNLGAVGSNLGASMISEPSGEAIAQVITHGEVHSPADVVFEAIGGLPMTASRTIQETIAAAQMRDQSPPPIPPSAPPALPGDVAEAPPPPSAPQPGVSSPVQAGPSATEAGAAPPPAIPPSSPGDPPAIPLPPMPPAPQTLAQIQTEQGVSSTDAARIRAEQEDAYVAWHDENMPGADVPMVLPGDPIRDAAVKRGEIEAALAEPPVVAPPPPQALQALSTAPDSAFNGDLEDVLNRVFLGENENESVPLGNVGFTPDEIAALQAVGLADRAGRMSRDQWARWLDERSARLAPRPRPSPAATTESAPQSFPISGAASRPAVTPHPGWPHAETYAGRAMRMKVAEHDAEGRPDADYRQLMSAGARDLPPRGMTWRDKALYYADLADQDGPREGPTLADLDAMPQPQAPLASPGEAFAKWQAAEAARGTRRRPARVQTPEDVAQAAAQVAEPTEAQKAAGNYQHGHVSIGGLPIAIETPAGATRSGTAPDGTRWTSTMAADYGRIKRTTGADGDQVDVFLGPQAHEAQKLPVWVIDQKRTDGSGMFDEHKAMVGFPTQEAARAAYLASFSDNIGTDRIGAMTAMKWPQFKRWAQSGNTQKPVAYKGPVIRARAKPRPKAANPSLLQFLADRGGLAPSGDLRAIMGVPNKSIFGMGGPKNLVRRQGMDLDSAREAAEEAGYIRSDDGSGTTTADLLNAIDEEMRGNKVFSQFQAGDAIQAEQDRQGDIEAERDADARALVQTVAAELGIRPPLTDADVAEAARLVRQGMDPEDAIERVLITDIVDAMDEPGANEVDPLGDFAVDLTYEDQTDEAADRSVGLGEDPPGEGDAGPQPVAGAEDAVPGTGVPGRDGGGRDGQASGPPAAVGPGSGAPAAEAQAAGGVAPREPWQDIEAFVAEAIGGDVAPDMAAASAALSVSPTTALAPHQMNRLKAFLEGKMPAAAVKRISAALPLHASLAQWAEVVATEALTGPPSNVKASAIRATRSAASKGDAGAQRLVDAAEFARRQRDAAQAEYQRARELYSSSLGFQQTKAIGGLAPVALTQMLARSDFQKAARAVRDADNALAAYRPGSTPAPTIQTETVDTLDGKREQGLIAGIAPITEEDRKAAAPPPAPTPQQPPGGMFGPVGQADLVSATSATYGNLAGPNQEALTEAFRKRIAERGNFPSVQQAMRYASQLLGGPVLPGSRAAATVESALQAAREYRTPAQIAANKAYNEVFAEHERARTEHMARRMSSEDYVEVRARFDAAQKALDAADRAANDEVRFSVAFDQTSTPQFDLWFGESKVVDAAKKPLVVYHGTQRDIEQFAPGLSFFTNSPVVASSYAEMLDDYGRPLGGNNGVVMPVYLRIERPLVVRMKGGRYDEGLSAKAIAAARANGHDGIIFRDTIDDFSGDGGEAYRGDVYVTFDPNQVKSAVGNTGAFSQKSDDIRMAMAPGRASPQAASLRAGARNQAARGDVRRGAEAIIDRLRMQANLDRAEARRQARNGQAGLRSVTDADAIREVDAFIQWLGERMVSDVGLRVSGQDVGAFGQFETSARIVTIFRRAIDADVLDRTMVHELWHAMESALPPADRAAVQAEYLRARDAWLAKNPWAQAFVSGNQILDQLTGQEAREWLAENANATGLPVRIENPTGANPVVRMAWSNETYRFRDRHEYFAETMADRYFDHRDIQDAKARSVFAHARDAFRRMVAALKRLFGRDATGRIFDGFGRQDYPTPAQRLMAEEGMAGGLDGIRAVRQDAMLSEIRFARAPTAQTAMPMAPQATFASPPESRLDTFIYEVQNKMVDLKRVQEGIRKLGRVIGLNADAYLAEELYHKRTAHRTEQFLNEELDPLVAEMVRRGVSPEDFHKFLHARQAPDYNAHVAARDPNKPDGGSGMMTADARAIMAGFTPQKLRDLSAVAQMVDAITARTRRILVQYGMEPQERIDAWEKMFPKYVPLNREDMDAIGGGPGSGQGFSVRGEFSRPALGSDRDVSDIIASIALQRERAIVRGEKNIVANAVIELGRQNPNSDFWTYNQAPRIRVLENGQVVSKVDPNYKGRDNVIVARSLQTRGPNAGREIIERTLTFNPANPRAVRMAQALKNLDMDDLGRVLGPVAKATRLIAALNTQYNPVFGFTNLVRDIGEGLINLSSTPLAGKQKEVAALIPWALRGIYADLRAVRRGGSTTNEAGKLFERFQAVGGQTGFRDMWATNADRAQAIEKSIRRVTEGKAMQLGREVFGWLSDYNDAMENSVRLAIFKVALDMGLSEQVAASIAKNSTVNFNRKGAMTSQVAALYAFFNAAVQGTARALKTLSSPAGKKIIAGGVLIGSMQALLLAGAGFSDEDIPDFIREKNLIIPIGGKRYLTIPMPLGFAALPNIGRIPTEIALSGGKDAGKKLANLISVVVDSVNPVGGGGSISSMITPTVADPILAVEMNEDWTGRAIARENISSLDERPGHERAKDNASFFSMQVSRALNRITGGTEFKPGMLSPSPDHIDYLVAQYAGGFIRETNKAIGAGISAARGDDVAPNRIPLVGRFYGNAEGPQAVRTAYFENIKRLNAHEAEIKGQAKAGRDPSGYIARNPEAAMFQFANREGSAIANMQRSKREMERQGFPRERIRELDALIAERMKLFNDLVKQAETRPR